MFELINEKLDDPLVSLDSVYICPIQKDLNEKLIDIPQRIITQINPLVYGRLMLFIYFYSKNVEAIRSWNETMWSGKTYKAIQPPSEIFKCTGEIVQAAAQIQSDIVNFCWARNDELEYVNTESQCYDLWLTVEKILEVGTHKCKDDTWSYAHDAVHEFLVQHCPRE